MMRRLLASILLLITAQSFADNVVNVYNWADYFPPELIQKFENETGIKVNYSTFEGNEELYAKLKANPNAGYDVIVPSSYYVSRMSHEGMLQRFDKNQLSNYKYLNPNLLHKPFDPNNEYSVPYVWGSTGLTINTHYYNPKNITRWSDLWQPQYQNQLLMLDDVREVFGIALITLGYSINDTNPDHIKQAYLKLKLLMPNIKLFNSDAVPSIYTDGDARIGMGWNGDIFNVMKENSDVTYTYPVDGFPIWIDCLAIPKNAPHVSNALKFINFVLDPQNAAYNAKTLGYSTPNMGAKRYLPKAMQNNPAFNPDPNVLRRAQLQQDIGPAKDIYEKYWELLKIGG